MIKGKSRSCVKIFSISVAAVAFIPPSIAGNFGSDIYSSWADTPKGKFECRQDKSTNHLQVLKLGGRLLYQQPRNDFIQGGNDLATGIHNENIGCPRVIASKDGYLIVVRDIQPPHYGIQGYALLNFNVVPPSIDELAEGQRPEDDKIPANQRITWTEKGFSVRYFGYPIDHSGGSADSPKPRKHEIGFDFATQDVKQIK